MHIVYQYVGTDAQGMISACRGSEMHEATRRLLGVLLRHLDGFESNKRSVVIAATNRKQDLDPALLSRYCALAMPVFLMTPGLLQGI